MPVFLLPISKWLWCALLLLAPALVIRTIGAQAPTTGKSHCCWRHIVLLGMVMIGLCGLVACGHEPPEQALRNTIADMQKAVEARDIDALFEPIAEDFVGVGTMDRHTFQQYVRLMAIQNQQLKVQLGPLAVQLFDQRAVVKFTAATRGGAGWLPERAQIYDVETGWRLEDGEWQLISAKWEPKL